jgi:DNA invertase Pin-like site-specific DNA recombinase
MDKKLRVAAYCRVSTDKDDQLNSLTNQQEKT